MHSMHTIKYPVSCKHCGTVLRQESEVGKVIENLDHQDKILVTWFLCKACKEVSTAQLIDAEIKKLKILSKHWSTTW